MELKQTKNKDNWYNCNKKLGLKADLDIINKLLR
jgi:hypothetical protein